MDYDSGYRSPCFKWFCGVQKVSLLSGYKMIHENISILILVFISIYFDKKNLFFFNHNIFMNYIVSTGPTDSQFFNKTQAKF